MDSYNGYVKPFISKLLSLEDLYTLQHLTEIFIIKVFLITPLIKIKHLIGVHSPHYIKFHNFNVILNICNFKPLTQFCMNVFMKNLGNNTDIWW